MSRACLLPLAITSMIASSLTGCGLLIGNVRPVEEKAENYRVLDLNRQDPDWSRLSSAEGPSESASGDSTDATTASPKENGQQASADLAFQSKRTSSIVSLNSACRPAREEGQTQGLAEFSRLLFLGITDVVQREERPARVADLPALETTVEGKLSGEPMKMKAVVLRKEDCIFDLMYVARPEKFPEQLEDFTRFVSSLKLK